MKAKLFEHALSIILVTCAIVILASVMRKAESTREAARTQVLDPYLKLEFLNLDEPLHRALLKETLDAFYPGETARHDSLIRAIERYRQERFAGKEFKTGGEERGLSPAKLTTLGGMYLQFILIYLIVMALTYHAAQSLAIFRFVTMKQRRKAPATGLGILSLAGRAAGRGAAYAVLFSPAYVIGYSVKSTFDTSSYLFLIVLGVVSNGVLINYANKFYTFLVSESRKGYVETALVKNLSDSFAWGTPDGVPYRAILLPKSLFPSHVFRHIYLNARFQYLPSLKEHASFLVTGLIIIEMALNIHGSFGYELLRNLLDKQYDVALAIIAGMFLIVKGTEVAVDARVLAEARKYENRGPGA